MQEAKPKEPFELSLITGVIIVIDGIIGLFGADVIWSFPDYFGHGRTVSHQGFNTIFLVLEAITGILIIFVAIMLYLQPRRHVVLSIVILFFIILSIPLGGGVGMGLAMGLFLGIIGSVWGIVWKAGEVSLIPVVLQTPPSPETLIRYTQKCPQCGSVILQNVKKCPNCGKSFEEDQTDT